MSSLRSSEPSQTSQLEAELNEMKKENLKLRSEYALILEKISEIAGQLQNLNTFGGGQLTTHAYILNELMATIKTLAEPKRDLIDTISIVHHNESLSPSISDDRDVDEDVSSSLVIRDEASSNETLSSQAIPNANVKTLKDAFFENAEAVSGLSHQTISDLLKISGLFAVGEIPTFTLTVKHPLSPASGVQLEFIFLGTWKNLKDKLAKIVEIQSFESTHVPGTFIKSNLCKKTESRLFRRRVQIHRTRYVNRFTIHAFSGGGSWIHPFFPKIRTFDFLKTIYGGETQFFVLDEAAFRTKSHNDRNDPLHDKISCSRNYDCYTRMGYVFSIYPGRSQKPRAILSDTPFDAPLQLIKSYDYC